MFMDIDHDLSPHAQQQFRPAAPSASRKRSLTNDMHDVQDDEDSDDNFMGGRPVDDRDVLRCIPSNLDLSGTSFDADLQWAWHRIRCAAGMLFDMGFGTTDSRKVREEASACAQLLYDVSRIYGSAAVYARLQEPMIQFAVQQCLALESRWDMTDRARIAARLVSFLEQCTNLLVASAGGSPVRLKDVFLNHYRCYAPPQSFLLSSPLFLQSTQ
jgi:hypothetical protein